MKSLTMNRLIGLLLLITLNLYGQSISQTINFQGVLKDASGNVVPDGNYDLTFSIYDAASNGNLLWSETQTLNVTGGVFSAQLGSVNPIDLPFDVSYWLGVTVGSGSELAPRTAFTSVPYSRMSFTVPDNSISADKIKSGEVVKSVNGLKDNVNLVAGSNVTITPSGNDLTISATGGGGGTVTEVNTGAGLTGGPITSTGTISVADDGITTAMLQNNSVTSDKISGNSVNTTHIVDGGVTTTDLQDHSVTTDKIDYQAVTLSNLANNSVNSDKIIDGGIVSSDIANAQVVKSVNGLKDNVNLVAGSNVTITPSGNDLTISATGGGGIGGSGTSNYIPVFNGSSTLSNSILYQQLNKIGIGTTSPDFSLTINSTPTQGLGLKISRSGGGLGMAFMEEDQPVDKKGWFLTAFAQRFIIQTVEDDGSTPIKNLMTYDRNGNIGIGTTFPQYPLHVSTNRKYAGYFTSDSLSLYTHVIHAEFTGTGAYDAKAVYGRSVPADNYGIGGFFIGGYTGVSGLVRPTASISTKSYYGVDGFVDGGFAQNYGVRGYARGWGKNYGVYGTAFDGSTNWAGYFAGNVNVSGTLSKGGGSFKIDHPLDPQNKYLYHSFVESPDMMNIYNGNVVTDASGYATVSLPEWFEALNKDFRYQLTVIGDFAQAIVAEEIQDNRFTIRTDKPNVKVSWQVTGIRHDKFAEKYRIPVEEDKQGEDVGKYLHPDAYGLPETMGIDYKHEKAWEERERQRK
jgi:hypothetical protein